jgi:hypothetical protein
MDELYDDYAGVCMGCDNTRVQCDCDGKDDEEFEATDCLCKNCAEDSDSTILMSNGYCDECYDQGCDEDDDLH